MNTWQHKKTVIIVLFLFILLLGGVLLTPVVRNLLFKNPAKSLEQTALPAIVPTETKALSTKKNLPIQITIPEGAGHIVEGFKAKTNSEKVIIHIQDIHTNYEAQKNLSRIIEVLIKDKGLKLIMVEGGWGNVSLSYLRSHAEKERRLEVGEEYLKAGKISGEEYLDIISDYDIDLEGLEDEELYKENLDTFFAIEQFRGKGTEELDKIKGPVEKLKTKMYPAQLLELEKAKQEYDDEKISLADYYKQIDALAKKTKQNMSAFPNFENFIKVTESEKNIDFPTVEKERSKLIETLSNKLSKQKLATLVTKSLEFRLNKLTPSEYHSYLAGEAKEAGENIDKYPNLGKYISYIQSHEGIDTAGLFEEAERIVLNIKDKIIANPQQKSLNNISNSLKVLDNFLNLKLVPDDFKYYKQNKDSFITANWVDFINKEITRYKLTASSVRPAYDVDKNLFTLVKFYDIANERDDIFVQNAIRLMNEKEQSIAVLITGGFHTPSLKQKLRECDISYIVVAPHTTRQTDPELYRYILKYKAGKEN